MNYLYTADELLNIRTNGWACVVCGRSWVDLTRGVSVPAAQGFNPDCRHRKLQRARIAIKEHHS